MTAPAIPPAIPKAERPAPSAPREYQFPRFERRRLENGVQLVVAPVAKLPLVTVAVLFDAGAVCDAAGREGTAQLVAKLLLEGTASSDGAELTERFERLGASVDAQADWDAAAVTLTALSEHLPAAFDLLGEVIRTPAFRVREVERLKAERLAELLQLRTEPRGLADELFARFLYASASRYSRPEGGDEQSIEALDRDQLVSFYESRYQPSGTTVIVAGDISADRAEELTRHALGEWVGGAARRITADDKPARSARGVHIIAKPDAPQSELRIGHVGIPRNHPDFFPVNVMNAVLGGLFNSRINMNLREAHGYTYGAFSGFEWRRQAGPFVVSTAVRSDITDAAAGEVLKEIDRIRSEAISLDELSLATSYLDGVFPIRFETTASIAAALSVLVLHGLPEDYYDRYRSRVRAITREQILEAAQRHLHPEMLQMVVVGDPSVIRDPLAAMNFGTVILYDTLGQPSP
jgi:zinc protease